MARESARAIGAPALVFDVVELDGRDLRGKALRERRRVLDRLASSHGMIFPARRLSNNGLKAWQEALRRNYEGIVAKDPESRYIPGRRSRGSR